MAQTADEIVVGSDGQIYVAPVGTTEPSDADDPLNAAFAVLGYTSEDGVTISDGKTVENIGAWQSFYTLRSIVTAREFNVSFVLRQWNRDQVSLAFGGGEFIETGAFTRYNPPDPSELDLRALVVDWQDGDEDFRLVVPKCLAIETVETQISRTAAADLPITMRVLAPSAGSQPWYLMTTSADFAS